MNNKLYLLILTFVLIFQSMLFAQEWESRASLPAGELGRNHPVTFSIDGMGYLVTGGTDQGFSNDFYRYDAEVDEWSILEAFPGPARGFSYGVSHQGKGYMGFGVNPNNQILDDLWEFDPATNTWTELASCPCDARFHPAFLANNGKLFVGLGGGGGNKKDWWEYDIATDTWAQKPDYPGAVRHHPYHFSIDDYVYVAFGHGNNAIFNDLYRYDPATEVWTRMADLPAEGRVAGTQFDYNGKGYALSGQGDDHFYLDTGEFWEYDPVTDSWTSLKDHPGLGRWAPGSFMIDGYIYLVAGEDSGYNQKKDMMRFDLNPSTGVSEFHQAEIKSVFPNPTRSDVLIDVVETIDQVQLLNQLGELIATFRPADKRIDLSSFPAGNYTLQITAEENYYVSRVVKL